MQLGRRQTEMLGQYCADLSKIMFASTVVAFFVPTMEKSVSLQTFGFGSLAAVVLLLASLKILED